MGSKQRKRKKQTVTQKYNTRVLAGKFLGIELKELKKATKKALRLADKLIKEAKQKIFTDQGIEAPNVTQLAKEQARRERESETPSIPQPETREPLDYAGDDEVANIDFSSPVLDEFLDTINEATTELIAKYGSVPQIWNIMSNQLNDIISTFQHLRVEIGDDNLATFLNNSLEYDALRTITMYSYNDAVNALDGLLSNLQGILNEAQAYNESPQEPFIAPTTITFE